MSVASRPKSPVRNRRPRSRIDQCHGPASARVGGPLGALALGMGRLAFVQEELALKGMESTASALRRFRLLPARAHTLAGQV
jgi:hypothetical protein